MNRYLLDTGIAQGFVNRRDGVQGRVDAERHKGNRIDIMIAAIAFSLGNCVVVTDDTDLAAVPGLPVESWTSSTLELR
jgi:predicted nucleic acid-binding protein